MKGFWGSLKHDDMKVIHSTSEEQTKDCDHENGSTNYELRAKALDELVAQAQELDMGYPISKHALVHPQSLTLSTVRAHIEA